MKTEAQRSTTLFKILSTHCYVLAILFITCMLRKTELNHFFWNTNRQPLIVHLFYFSLLFTLVGTGLQGHDGATLWPVTGLRGKVQVHWLAGKVGGDCSKLAVGRLLMLSRDGGVQLPHLASLSGLSQLLSPCLFVFKLHFNDKSGDILCFSYYQQIGKTNSNNDWTMIQLTSIACVAKA